MLKVFTIEDLKEKIGSSILQLRKDSDISQGELADALSLSRATVQKLEKGDNVTLTTLLLAIEYFDKKKEFSEFLDRITEQTKLPDLYN